MTTDGFLVCDEHGDIFWCQGADWGTPIEAHTSVPVHPQAPAPVSGGPTICFCGARLRPVLRPSLVVRARS